MAIGYFGESGFALERLVIDRGDDVLRLEAVVWLQLQADLGLASRTIEAYARGRADYLGRLPT